MKDKVPLRHLLTDMGEVLLELSDKLNCVGNILRHDAYYLDTETTGVNTNTARIWQIGCLLVKGGKVDKSFNRIIQIPREAYDSCPQNVKDTIRLTWERVQAGVSEERAVSDLMEFLDLEPTFPILGHNVARFDGALLQLALLRNNLKGLEVFDSSRVIDTGVIVKAARMGRRFYQAESPDEFTVGVRDAAIRGLRWSLDFVVDELGLRGQLGGETHDAIVDCTALMTLVNLCMTALRERADRCES